MTEEAQAADLDRLLVLPACDQALGTLDEVVSARHVAGVAIPAQYREPAAQNQGTYRENWGSVDPDGGRLWSSRVSVSPHCVVAIVAVGPCARTARPAEACPGAC